MAAAANAVLAVLALLVFGIWIHALVTWDGKCPCRPEDCEDCPYSGTGCTVDPKTDRKQTDNTLKTDQHGQ